ncbi:Crp/Fnr family transcriptional regulator [Jiulongibacter sediminis]|uniref:Crp/Fnr family transcriptional regulator n=1 Tax=Jiulongibacter sediminis TaxID=1605367 RepID=UPI0026EEE932|nr:hypothetical protein [Jiulongibacter sediminis]
MNTLEDILMNKFRLSEGETSMILNHFKLYKIPKGTFLINELQNEPDLFFLNQGLLREFYFYEEDGTTFENTTELVMEDEFYLEIDSNINKNSNINLQAQIASTVYRLDHQKLKTMIENIDQQNNSLWNTFLRRVLIERLAKLTRRRFIMGTSRKSSTRYSHFLKVFRPITNLLSDKIIASYLGLSQSTLSAQDKIEKR